MENDLSDFDVTTDSGEVLRVLVIPEPRIDTSTFDGPSSIASPSSELRLVNGMHLTPYGDKDTFMIAETCEIVRRKH